MGLPGWMPGRPGGCSQRLTQIADAWDALDTTLLAAERQLAPRASEVSAWWRGQAATAYTAAWADYSTGLPPLHRQIEAISGLLHVAAFAIWSAQQRYDQVVEEVVAGTVVLTGAAFFTFGLSEVGEGGILTSASATITELLTSLGAALAQVAAEIAEALSAIGRVAAALLLPLGGSAGAGSGLALALAGGGAMTITTTAAGATEMLVGGVVVAVGGAAIDAMLAKALGGGGQASFGSGAGGSDVNAGDHVPRKYESDTDSLNHFGSRHGSDFGFPRKTPSVDARATINDYLQDWIRDPAHDQIVGTYQRKAAIFYLDPATRQVVFTYPDGQFWGGFVLGKPQLVSLLTTGGFA